MKLRSVAQAPRGIDIMENSKFKVVEIFRSVSGESINSGQIAVFIRLYGCNLRCSYCDTPYGYEGGEYVEMTAEEVRMEAEALSPNGLVVLTGGEPLVHPQVEYLLKELLEHAFCVEIETNGSIDIRKIATRLDEIEADFEYSQLSFTVDYKCPSSEVMTDMLPINEFYSMIKDVMSIQFKYECAIKFVVSTLEDLKVASSVSSVLMGGIDSDYPNLIFGERIFISPVYGADIPKIVNFMENDEVLCWCRLQLQIHKYIWDPDKRGV